MRGIALAILIASIGIRREMENPKEPLNTYDHIVRWTIFIAFIFCLVMGW